MLSLHIVDEKVQEIQKVWKETRDSESCHVLQDQLWEAVLIDISNFSTDAVAREQAKQALKVMEIDFKRWAA